MLYTNTKLQREIMATHARALSLLAAAKGAAVSGDDSARREFLSRAAAQADAWAKLIKSAVGETAAVSRTARSAVVPTPPPAAEPTKRKAVKR